MAVLEPLFDGWHENSESQSQYIRSRIMGRRIALPINDSSLVCACDFSDTMMVADIVNGTVEKKSAHTFVDSFPSLRAGRLKNMQVDTVLCGAISDPLALMIWHCGIEVIPGLCGHADELIDAYIRGELAHFHTPDFHPGFSRWCRRRKRGRMRGRRNRWR
jgi:predicted Fe-Mo cluster-binding NifX family protein